MMATHGKRRMFEEYKQWIRQEYREGRGDLYLTSSASKAGSEVLRKVLKEDLSTEVLVLTSCPSGEKKELLSRLTKAICDHLRPALSVDATVYEKEGSWSDFFASMPRLRKILISEGELHRLPALFRGYKPLSPARLYGVPLLLLADPGAYVRDPHLKKILWDLLRSELS